LNQHIIDQGVELMLTGMGAVFVFLVLLVGATTIMSFLLSRFVKDVEEQNSEVLQQAPATAIDQKTLAAIHAAVKLHRAAKGRG